MKKDKSTNTSNFGFTNCVTIKAPKLLGHLKKHSKVIWLQYMYDANLN